MTGEFPVGRSSGARSAARATRFAARLAAVVLAMASNAGTARAPDFAAPEREIYFGAITATLAIALGRKQNQDEFRLHSEFTLGQSSSGIDPSAEPVTIEAGTFTATIPQGSFKGKEPGPFHFLGLIDGVYLDVAIRSIGAKRYALDAKVHRANLAGTELPVTVRIAIGSDSGTTYVWEPEPLE